MESHSWLYPWLALTAGLIALLVGAGCMRGDWRKSSGAGPPRSALALWLIVTVGAALVGLRLGNVAGVDFLVARGILLGSLGGAVLAYLSRKTAGDSPDRAADPPPYLCPIILGLVTSIVAIARLWLTHGEISGLSAVVLGAALALMCLGALPAAGDQGRPSASFISTLGLVYLLCLAAAVELGFTRAGILKQLVWADLPLLIGGVLSLGALASAGLVRAFGAGSLWGLSPMIAAALIGSAAARELVHSWRPLELIAVGANVLWLLLMLARRGSGLAMDDPATLVGLTMAAAAPILGFKLYAGYGIALLLLGGWSVAAWALLQRRSSDSPAGAIAGGGLGFGAILLIHRLAILSSGTGIRASGPGDTWDLFSITVGIFFTLAAAAWAQPSDTVGLHWTRILEWILLLGAGGILVDYVWGPRFVAGVLLGACLAQLIGAMQTSAFSRATLSSVTLSLIILLLLPLVGQMQTPTRQIRIEIIAACAALALLRLLVAPLLHRVRSAPSA